MKRKFTFLMAAFMLLAFLAVPLGMRGQTREESTLLTEDFSTLTAGNSTSSSGSNTAWSGNSNFPDVTQAYQAGGAVRIGSSKNPGSITSKSLSVAAGTLTVAFDVKGWTSVEGNIKVTVGSQNQTVTYTATMSGSFESKSVNFTISNAGSMTVKLESTAKRVFLDNIVITNTTSGGGGPQTTSDLTITNASTDLTFDLYNNSSAQTVTYTTSSTGEISIFPVSPTSYFSYVHDATEKTITVTPLAVTPSTQTVTISQAADATYNAGSVSFTVSVANSAPLANIAALTAQNTDGSYAVSLTDALITYVNGTNAYLEDASGAVILYHCAGDLAVGDKITGSANVTYTVYNNLPEVTAITLEEGYTKTTGNTVTPAEVTIADLNGDNYASYISRYVKIVDATVTAAFNNRNCTIEQSGSSIALRDQNNPGTLTTTVNDVVTVTAHPSIYNTTRQIAVYEQSQIVVAKVNPTITFNNGTVRVGQTLNLNTLFTSNSTGAVTYSITAGGSYATLEGSTLTGTAEGSVTVKAAQAETSSYNAGEATATITVDPALVLSSIAVTTPPTKTTYDEGENFDPTGMVVTATYSDSSTDVVTDYTYSPNGALATTDTEITISYTESGVTKTATQPITVNEVVDYAMLPFSWAGGVLSDFNALNGTSYSLDKTDSYGENNAPYRIKFTKTGDYLQVKTDSQPDIVTIGVKMIGGSNTSTITVQGSADGQTFTDIETLTISGNQNDELTLTSTQSFGAGVRYVRLYFTKGSNVGVGPISITKYVAPENHNLTVTLGEHVEAIFVFNAADNTEALIEDGAPGTVSVLSGTSIEVSPMAASGYVISSLIVNNEDVTSQMDVSGAYTFTMPASDVTITATAVEEPYTISFFVNGIEFVTAEMEVTPGQTIGTLPIPADNIPEGFTFVGWMEWPDHPYYNATTAPTTMVTAATVPSDDMILDAVFCIGETAQGTWTLSNSVPAAGDQIILAVEDGGNYYAMFASESELTSTSFTVSSNAITGTVPSGWTVENGSYTTGGNTTTGLSFFSGQYKDVQGTPTKMYLHLNSSAGKIATGFQNGVFEFGDDNILHSKVNDKYLTFESTAFGVSSNEADACQILIFKYAPGATTNKDYTTSVVYHANNTTIAETAAEILYGIHYINGYVLAGNEVTNNGKLVINNGGLLDMDVSNLNNLTAANLIIKDGAQMKYNSPFIGTIEKSITGYENYTGTGNGGYYLIASPVSASVNPTLVPTNSNDEYLFDDMDFYWFDGLEVGQEWQNAKYDDGNGIIINALQTMPSKKGFLYARKETGVISISADNNNMFPATGTGIVADNLSNVSTTAFGKHNLIGNPYTCNAFVGRAYYRMNPAGDDFTAAAASEPIKPLEGVFIVFGEAETADEVTFTTTDPTSLNAGPTNSNISINASKVVTTRGNSNDVLIDRAIVHFGEGQMLPKFMLNPDNTKLYIPQGNKDYAVVRSEARGEMPVNFKAAENGTYTIDVEAENLEVNYLHLIDNLTGMDVDLLATPSYTFEARKSDIASRFRLVFDANTGNDETNDNFAFINNGELIVNGNGTVQVIDILGRQMFSHEVNSSFRIQNSSFAPGVYVLRLVNGNNVKTQKIVIK